MKQPVLALYALAHFWVDFSCALLLLGTPWGWGVFLLYNFLAFAVQMPLGLLADRVGGAHRFAALGCALAALAWALGGPAAAVAAGLGNALFHVGGGLYALNGSSGCGALGLFVSPGALGIYLGALPAVGAALPPYAVWLPLLLLGVVLVRRGRGEENAPFTPAPKGGGGALLPLLALFAVVVVRALMGGIFRFPWRGELGLALAVAVAGGKWAGGLLADRFGVRRATAWSLGAAAVLFLCSDAPAAGLGAVFAFNMTMPVTLRGAADLLCGAKGFAFGLLTFALFLGTLPVLWGLALPAGGQVVYTLGAAVSLLLLGVGLRRRAGACRIS